MKAFGSNAGNESIGLMCDVRLMQEMEAFRRGLH